jgi:uncharacterized protein (TIGR02118 family)
MIKIVFCLRRLSKMSLPEFQRYWFDVHAPLVRRHRDVLRISKYTQLHSDLGELTQRLTAFRNAPEPYDGVAEIWYDSHEALGALGSDPRARAASRELRDDEARFIDLTRSPIWVAEERPIII